MPGMDGFSLAELITGNPALENPNMIMLSSAARPGDSQRCREMGIARHMTKPVIKSELFEAIVDSLDEQKGEPETRELDGMPSSITPLDILLVEDGLINQRVATAFLERAGHRVSLANNGQQAVDMTEQRAFDLVLMDVQMPVMDGHEATAIIRERERRTGGHLRIIAMTAAAMKGDREECMEAGMDAYISKPIDPDELLQTFAQQVGSHEPSVPEEAAPATVRTGTPCRVDFDAAARHVPGGLNDLEELAKLFLEECSKLMDEFTGGLASAEPKAVRRAAHTLRNSARIVEAQEVAECSARAEVLAANEEFRDLEICLPELRSIAEETCGAIRSWLHARESRQ